MCFLTKGLKAKHGALGLAGTFLRQFELWVKDASEANLPWAQPAIRERST